jgi:hypothetical protein
VSTRIANSLQLQMQCASRAKVSNQRLAASDI